MQDAAFANQRNGHTNERGDAGAVNLRDAVEINDHFASAVFQNGVESGGELVTGIADGQASVDVENADAGFFANVDFDGGVLGHGLIRVCKYNFFTLGLASTSPKTLKPVNGSGARHYTMTLGMAGK